MRRVKVLHVLTTTAGGLGQSVLSMILGLDPKQFEVAVSFGPGYPMDQRFVDHGVHVFPVRMRRGLSLTNLLGFWDLYCLFRRERFDVVHAHSSIAGLLARLAARLAQVPVIIFTLHGYATLDYEQSSFRSLLWIVEKLLDRCTDYYVAICAYVERSWVQRGIVSSERVTVIYNGVDPESILRPIDQDQKRKSLNLSLKAPVIGTIGLLEPQKGTEYLIRAIPQVVESFPESRFVVIGDGPLYERLKKLAEELGISSYLYLLGWRDDATNLLGIMDIFCLPSLREGFSVALLEAMTYAKPIIATQVAGNPEAVSHGETGLLVPTHDPYALSKAILYFLGSPEIAQEMGRRGRARLMERFTVRKMHEGYNRLYQRAFHEKGIGC